MKLITFYGIVRSLDRMNSVSNDGFKNCEAVSNKLVKVLSRNSHTASIKRLQNECKRLGEDNVKLRTDLAKTETKVEFDKLVKRIQKLEQKNLPKDGKKGPTWPPPSSPWFVAASSTASGAPIVASVPTLNSTDCSEDTVVGNISSLPLVASRKSNSPTYGTRIGSIALPPIVSRKPNLTIPVPMSPPRIKTVERGTLPLIGPHRFYLVFESEHMVAQVVIVGYKNTTSLHPSLMQFPSRTSLFNKAFRRLGFEKYFFFHCSISQSQMYF